MDCIILLMTYSQLLMIIEEAELSAEQAAKRMGISGMTVRRWKAEPPDKKVPDLYANACRELIYRLIPEKRLRTTSKAVAAALIASPPSRVQAVMAHLGIDTDMLDSGEYRPERVIEALSKIGHDKAHIREVSANKAKIMALKGLGEEPWRKNLAILWKVVSSPELHSFEKFVAYGALFYILTPFDLIADCVPLFGYVDDLFMAGAAVAYYVAKHPELFG